MSSNYDGSSVGQKQAQYGALEELYRRWDAATDSKVEDGSPIASRPSLLPKLVVACVVLGLIVTVVMLGWALL